MSCECDYSYVCNACQVAFELQARDARTENRVDTLENRIKDLEEKLEQVIWLNELRYRK